MAAEIVVVGSANLDLVVEVDRVPAVGETVMGGDLRRIPEGKAQIRLLPPPGWGVMSPWSAGSEQMRAARYSGQRSTPTVSTRPK